MGNKAIIVTTNYMPDIPVKGFDLIGIENGAKYLVKEKIPMAFAIGDFDSITTASLNTIKKRVKTIVLPEEKDETDLEAAILHARSIGYKEIIVCADGPRLDHDLNQLQLAKKYNVVIYTPQNKITWVPGRLTVNKGIYKYVSLFVPHKAKVTMSGVKFPIVNTKISFDDTKYVSNEIIKSFADITARGGDVFVIQSNDK